MKLWLKHPLMLIVSRPAPLVQNCLCVSSEAVYEMRAGLSMAGEGQPPSAAADCMLRCSKEQGGERCNRCVCKRADPPRRRSGYEVSIIA
jgi:hypothetical protein